MAKDQLLDEHLRQQTVTYLDEIHSLPAPAGLDERFARTLAGRTHRKPMVAVVGAVMLALVGAITAGVVLAARATPMKPGNQSLTVMNSGDSAVAVVFWPGARSYNIPPGVTEELNADGAPPQPWLVTISSPSSHHVMFQQKVSEDHEVIVQTTGVIVIPMSRPQATNGP